MGVVFTEFAPSIIPIGAAKIGAAAVLNNSRQSKLMEGTGEDKGSRNARAPREKLPAHSRSRTIRFISQADRQADRQEAF